MRPAPQVEPISNFQRAAPAIIQKLAAGPVFLSQRGTLAAAIVSIAEWNRIAAMLEELQDRVDVLEAELELATGEDQLLDADLMKLERMAHGEPVPA